jgi:hypothetical protein
VGIKQGTYPVSISTQAIAAECGKNWKAAASDDKKRMWSIFDETGIFVCACRHGFVLWYANMVRSDELYVASFEFTKLEVNVSTQCKVPSCYHCEGS